MKGKGHGESEEAEGQVIVLWLRSADKQSTLTAPVNLCDDDTDTL